MSRNRKQESGGVVTLFHGAGFTKEVKVSGPTKLKDLLSDAVKDHLLKAKVNGQVITMTDVVPPNSRVELSLMGTRA